MLRIKITILTSTTTTVLYLDFYPEKYLKKELTANTRLERAIRTERATWTERARKTDDGVNKETFALNNNNNNIMHFHVDNDLHPN